MKRILFACFLLWTIEVKAQTVNIDPRFANMDVYADSVLKQFHIAGFSVAVIENDKLIYAKGFGYRDYEKKLPVTPNTVFPIASCTKAFTAALCGILDPGCGICIYRRRLRVDRYTRMEPGDYWVCYRSTNGS